MQQIQSNRRAPWSLGPWRTGAPEVGDLRQPRRRRRERTARRGGRGAGEGRSSRASPFPPFFLSIFHRRIEKVAHSKIGPRSLLTLTRSRTRVGVPFPIHLFSQPSRECAIKLPEYSIDNLIFHLFHKIILSAEKDKSIDHNSVVIVSILWW